MGPASSTQRQSELHNETLSPKTNKRQKEKEHEAGTQKEKRKELRKDPKCINSHVKIRHRCNGWDGKIQLVICPGGAKRTLQDCTSHHTAESSEVRPADGIRSPRLHPIKLQWASFGTVLRTGLGERQLARDNKVKAACLVQGLATRPAPFPAPTTPASREGASPGGRLLG